MNPEKKAYQIDEFCWSHGIGRTKAYEEIVAGRLKVFKVGRRTLVSVAAAENWQRLCEANTTIICDNEVMSTPLKKGGGK